MAIIIKTIAPADLLFQIKKEIDDQIIGSWSYDDQGDFTYCVDRWKETAWLKAKIYQGELRFGIITKTEIKLNTAVYGVYHGRFIEMLLTRFDRKFTSAYATAQKTLPDDF